VNEQLDKDFAVEDEVEIIAEPGSYMVSSSSVLAVNIIGKRILSKTDLYNGIVPNDLYISHLWCYL
jgi:diaminopimelate decarboxylase